MKKEQYLINGDTMVILPHFDEYGYPNSLVIEEDRELLVKEKPLEIMNNSCLYNGSSFQGRVDGATHVTKYNRMVPIMICNRQGIYFYPTQSPKSESCIWFAHDHVKEIHGAGSENCEVLLTNNISIPVPVTKAAMETKVNRTAQYRHLVNQHYNTQRSNRKTIDIKQLVAMESTGAYRFMEDHLYH